MIDLRHKGLPDHIEVAGKSYLIYTDFREWLKVSEVLKDKYVDILDLAFIIKDDITVFDLLTNKQQFLEQILAFYTNPNVTPHDTGNSSNVIVDYILDGEFIVGSFMQSYGIDLTTCDMHWHMFKALFLSLPEDCKINQIMTLRSYKKSSMKYEAQCEHLKSIWSLPNSISREDSEIMEEINKEFYNC